MRKQFEQSEGRSKALKAALQNVEKHCGRRTVQLLGDDTRADVRAIPSGSLTLDIALGGGGYPAGRIIEIYGPESSGKTTLALSAIAEVQRGGGTAMIIDTEHALDPSWAATLGVDLDQLYMSQPDTGEDALYSLEQMTRSGALDVIVVDSVAALTPKAEIEGEMGDAVVGLHARLMSQAMRKLRGIVASTGTTVIFTNQLRHKIGVMFGSPETTTGGNALKFYASIRLDVRKRESIKVGDEYVGNRTKVRVVKNKVAPPMREAEIELMFARGFNTIGEIVDLGVKCGLIEKSGSWYSYKGEQLCQGREKCMELVQDKPALMAELYGGIRSEFGLDESSEDYLKEPELGVEGAKSSGGGTVDEDESAESKSA